MLAHLYASDKYGLPEDVPPAELLKQVPKTLLCSVVREKDSVKLDTASLVQNEQSNVDNRQTGSDVKNRHRESNEQFYRPGLRVYQLLDKRVGSKYLVHVCTTKTNPCEVFATRDL